MIEYIGTSFHFMCGICYVTSRHQLAFVSCFVMIMAGTFHMPTRIHQKSKNSKKSFERCRRLRVNGPCDTHFTMLKLIFLLMTHPG